MSEVANPFDEMSTDEFFEFIRNQYSDVERQKLYEDLHREHILIALPETQIKAKNIINHFKSIIEEDELISINFFAMPAESLDLQIIIVCNEIGISKDDIKAFSEIMNISDGLTISEGRESDTIRISILINDFYQELN